MAKNKLTYAGKLALLQGRLIRTIYENFSTLCCLHNAGNIWLLRYVPL